MKTHLHYSLERLNSFKIKSIAPKVYCPSSVADLIELSDETLHHSYVLGEGSNSLFCEDNAPIIIKPEFLGISTTENEDTYFVSAACGENWHQLVGYCINQGIFGLENLALIPGSVGAAPVQNIGAYGVEVSNFIDKVTWYCFEKKQIVELDNLQCQFGYRESIFKGKLKGKGIITHVHFKFPKQWQAVLIYPGLNHLAVDVSAKSVMDTVITIRQSKLPDPNQLANAGSFFKNPLVNRHTFELLKLKYPEIPHYPQSTGELKLAAGWLIEQAGLKGYKQNHVGVHEKQALVLVNYAADRGSNIVELAKYVHDKIFQKFAISLEPEVRFIDNKCEYDPVSKGVI